MPAAAPLTRLRPAPASAAGPPPTALAAPQRTAAGRDAAETPPPPRPAPGRRLRPPPPSGRQGAPPLPPEAPLAAAPLLPRPLAAEAEGWRGSRWTPHPPPRRRVWGPSVGLGAGSAASPPLPRLRERRRLPPAPPVRRGGAASLGRGRSPEPWLDFPPAFPQGERSVSSLLAGSASHHRRGREVRAPLPPAGLAASPGPEPAGARGYRPSGLGADGRPPGGGVSEAPGVCTQGLGICVEETRRWHREESITGILSSSGDRCVTLLINKHTIPGPNEEKKRQSGGSRLQG